MTADCASSALSLYLVHGLVFLSFLSIDCRFITGKVHVRHHRYANEVPRCWYAGFSPIDAVATVKSRQLAEKNPHLGIDCNETGTADMKEQNVFDTLAGKKQQMFLATQARIQSFSAAGGVFSAMRMLCYTPPQKLSVQQCVRGVTPRPPQALWQCQ